MTSGKKGTQIYFSFLSKVPANESPPGSPTGPLRRGRTVYRAFFVYLKNLTISISFFTLIHNILMLQAPECVNFCTCYRMMFEM
jgi:hypothetical protein